MSNRVLPRKQESEVEKTVMLRPRDPSDHRQFEEILPWFTPLFVWQDGDIDWVRWSVPQPLAEKMGITSGCACCGKETQVDGGHGDYLVATAWHETDWWLTANGYSRTPALQNATPPTKEEGEPS